MSATITTTAIAPDSRLRATGIIRSEWIKLRSVRSTVWLYAIMVAGSVGIAALVSAATGLPEVKVAPEEHAAYVLQATTIGAFIGQLVAAVLGVLVVGSEYSTGMIRSTLTAVPKRLPALGAKLLVLFVATFVVGLVSSFGSLLVALPILASYGIEADFSDGSLLGNLVLAALYLALVSVFALGIGTVLRSSAAGIAAALGAILLLPTVNQFILAFTGAEWPNVVARYLFSNAGGGIYTPSAGGDHLEQWQNLLVVLAWVIVPLVSGAVLLRRRDA